ncbi:hypothetical protein Pmani_005134 [Petrolisthes manimaculis]|uniref:Gag-like protein n=1 Tax=Petrolisthes manimaculis TaxID=1843537 RepID=A0AAE1QCF6_9EUCA|nr:hypothetical protein Pmani_005134 [Petrolisthes manimaculis]
MDPATKAEADSRKERLELAKFKIARNAYKTKSTLVSVGSSVTQDLDAIRTYPSVKDAKSCLSRDKTLTRQVLITYIGKLPEALHLGPFGKDRLSRCQKYRHHKAVCKNPIICGICSGLHETKTCTQAHKDGQKTTSRCPNGLKSHHVWFRSCPARLEKVHQAIRPRNGKKRAPSPRPKSTAWKKAEDKQQPPPLQDDEEFPPASQPGEKLRTREWNICGLQGNINTLKEAVVKKEIDVVLHFETLTTDEPKTKLPESEH